MKYSVRIDWVTLTKRGYFPMPFGDEMNLSNAEHIAHAVIRELLPDERGTRREKNNPFYAYAFRGLETGVVVHVALDVVKQGVMVVFSGQACDYVGDMRDTLKRAIDLEMSLTRADVAFDIHNGGESVRDLATLHDELYGEEPPRKTAFISSKGGDTFYVGSRSSPKMVRVYDKAAQQKVHADWVRVELELKYEAARNAMAHLSRYPAAMGSVIAQVVGVPSSRLMQVCEDAAQGDITLRSTKEKTQGDRLLWLMKSVMPAIETLLHDNPAEFDVFSEAFAALEDERWNGKPDNSPLDE